MAPEDTTQREARALARLARPLLLLGERGTGKTTLARRVHEWSGCSGVFVRVNCAAIPESLFESEMFGHVAGAFTGATSRRVGRFERAHGGTLFLDEIGELQPALQAKLLECVESREIWPVGASAPIACSPRMLAATNREPSSLRPDLLDRFLLSLELPPLRSRGDLAELLEQCVASAARELGCQVVLGSGAAEWCRRYTWPGNLRELERAVLSSAALGCGEISVRGLERAVGATLAPTIDEAAAELTRAREWWSTGELVAAAGCSESTALRWLRQHAQHNERPTSGRLWRVVGGPLLGRY